ncbi:cupin domain-containing protein [Limnohabitans sp.]|uniref:cupin domain-containing protein n=1 Tax=Limnohabitans sp. TaxID=1907725 RepID=UPI0038BE160F
MATAKKASPTPARKTAPAVKTAKAVVKKAALAQKAKVLATAKPAKPAKAPASVKKAKAAKVPKVSKASKAAQTSKATPKPVKPGKPPVIKWGPQKFVANHLKDAVFKTGLRDYAQYRDLGMTEATGGAAQAHVIRLLGKCDPKVVSIPHYHGVQFQMLYFLKGWMIGEYEGQGRVKMTAGSCWLQPPGIRHTVIDYSPDCEMVEIILPANFETVEFE